MTPQTHLTVTDFIDSLLNDRHDDTQPTIPDALTDLSYVANGLRTLSKEGRVLHSDESYSIGNTLGTLLQTFIPEKPTEDDYTAAIFALTIFIGRILRAIPEIVPDLSIEEFLVEPAEQQSLIELAQTMTAIPVITTPNGHQRPNIAQLSVFHTPIAITEQAKDGFAKRQIEPYDNLELPITTDLLSFMEQDEMPPQTEEFIVDSLDGFDEFFDAYFEKQAESDEE